MGDVEGAIREQKKVREQDPRNVGFALGLAFAYMHAGDLTSSRQTIDQALRQQPANYLFRMLWALQLALEDKREDALRAMDPEVLKYADLVLMASFAAEFYAVLGDKEKALDWLDKDVRLGDERAEWFERDPLLTNIRQESRFRQILEPIRSRRGQKTNR